MGTRGDAYARLRRKGQAEKPINGSIPPCRGAQCNGLVTTDAAGEVGMTLAARLRAAHQALRSEDEK